MLVLTACATSLSAQITREQADLIVYQHIQNEVNPPYFLYVNVNAPNEDGIAITTYQKETMKVKYACWSYYLNENPDVNGPCQHRYLFVKEDDGNLLEVITSNDIIPDLTQWTEVITGINESAWTNIEIYPNPTQGELIVKSDELRVMSVEIFDVFGRNVSCLKSHVSCLEMDISHLSNGVYFVKITTPNGTVTKKIVKQ